MPSIPRRQITPAARFWPKVDTSAGPTGCWIWTGARHSNGYGKLVLDGRRAMPYTYVLAHRFSYTVNVGPIPEGMLICHRCDEPLCVNPTHLFLGTIQDNNLDKLSKGRQAVQAGVNHPLARFDEDDVRDIRIAYLRGQSYNQIAAFYGVTKSAIAAIVQRRTWKNVE